MRRKRYRPCDRIRHVNRSDSMIFRYSENRSYPDKPESAGPHKGYRHRHDRIPDTSYNADHYIHHAAQGICSANHLKPHHAGLHRNGIIRIYPKKLSAEYDGKTAENDSGHNDACLSGKKRFLNPVGFTGSIVLSRERKRRMMKRVHGRIYKSFYIGGRRIACHDNLAEYIYGRLDYHIGQRKYRTLKTCRQSYLHYAEKLFTVYAKLPEFKVHHSFILNHTDYYKHRRYSLRNNGSYCDSCHIKLKYDNEKQIEPYVHHSRQKKKIKRSFCVAYRAKYCASEIVNHHGRHSQKIYSQIKSCQIKNIFRGIHKY